MAAVDCFGKDLSAYFDGELPTEETSMVEEHIQGCMECRLALDRIRTLSSVVQAMPRPEVNPLFIAQLMKQLQPQTISDTTFIRLFESWGIFSLAAIVLMAVIPFSYTLLSLFYAVMKHLAIVAASFTRLIWGLPLASSNLLFALIFLMGAIVVFYGFDRVYVSMTKELMS